MRGSGHGCDHDPIHRARRRRRPTCRQLNTASVRRVIEPEDEFDLGRAGRGPDDPRRPPVRSTPTSYGLTPEQRATLSREEVASLLESGVRFETVLISGFALELAERRDSSTPARTYSLHEMGEETRHSRAFLRLVEQIEPTRPPPADEGRARCSSRNQVQRNLPAPPGAAVRLRAGRRGDPRPHAEAGVRAPRDRPPAGRGQPLPPPGGGPAPRLRPHAAARAAARPRASERFRMQPHGALRASASCSTR